MPRARQSDPLLTQTASEKFNLIDLIPMYDGGESLGIRRFLEKINDVANLGKWSNDEKVTILKLKLAGIAEEYFLSDPTHSHLTEIFQSGNSAQNTAVRNANDQLLQSRFISGLRNDIRRFVLARDPINLEESISAALIEEQNVKLNQIANDERSGLSPSKTEISVISALTNKLEEINLRVERLQKRAQLRFAKQVGIFLAEGRLFSNVFIVAFKDIGRHSVGKSGWTSVEPITSPPGETPRANFLFSVTQALILSIGDMSISKNRLFAIITQPPGIRRAGHTRLLGIGVFNAILETTI
ncbi:hypothetical protein TNCV_4116351 [Trichonephila clavipes]|nr:hypothetical protein TNCV_4116351 [Trichonephila clavipes]